MITTRRTTWHANFGPPGNFSVRPLAKRPNLSAMEKNVCQEKNCLPCQCYLFDLQSQFTKYKRAPGYQLTNSSKTSVDLILTMSLLCWTKTVGEESPYWLIARKEKIKWTLWSCVPVQLNDGIILEYMMPSGCPFCHFRYFSNRTMAWTMIKQGSAR